MKKLSILLCLLLTATIATEAWAKRMPPKPVAPVVQNGIKYVAPLDNGRQGKVEAWDEKSGKKLWEVAVYTVKIDPNLEKDVQWVFITGLAVRDNSLFVTNEKNQQYKVDLATKKVEKLGSATAADSPQKSHPDPFAQNKRLGRGVNIIGYDPLWRDRAKGRFQEKHFRLIKEAGFDSVRINLHPFRDAQPDSEGTISRRYFDTLDWAVQQSLANKLVVILDFHEFTQMGDDLQRNRPRFLAMWREIAEHCKGLPDEVLFEILNEPNKQLTPEKWNELFPEALAIIRRTNPSRTVIVGPGQWNNISALDKLVLPEDDRNLILTVHYYSPFEFTHQGTSWTGQKDKVGIPWKGTLKEQQAVERDLDKAQSWAKRHNRPVYLGEFGAFDKADMPSRVRYIAFVARQAEKLGWSWGYWQFDGDFIVYDMKKQAWVEGIRDALVPRESRRGR